MSAVPQSLAEIVLEEGMVERSAVVQAADRAEKLREPLVVVLVRRHGVDELALVAAIRRHVRVAVADPVGLAIDTDALRDLPRDVCRRLRVLPLAVATPGVGPRRLRLAMADPTDTVTVAEVEHLTGCQVEPVLVHLSAIEELVESAYRAFVTQVMPREREPFGGALQPTTPPLRPDGEPPHGPNTSPFHRVADEADAATRVRALIRVLVAKQLIREEDVDEEIRRILKGRAGDG
jgi:hypothetical protein